MIVRHAYVTISGLLSQLCWQHVKHVRQIASPWMSTQPRRSVAQVYPDATWRGKRGAVRLSRQLRTYAGHGAHGSIAHRTPSSALIAAEGSTPIRKPARPTAILVCAAALSSTTCGFGFTHRLFGRDQLCAHDAIAPFFLGAVKSGVGTLQRDGAGLADAVFGDAGR